MGRKKLEEHEKKTQVLLRISPPTLELAKKVQAKLRAESGVRVAITQIVASAAEKGLEIMGGGD